jgi:hypothetical protein
VFPLVSFHTRPNDLWLISRFEKRDSSHRLLSPNTERKILQQFLAICNNFDVSHSYALTSININFVRNSNLKACNTKQPNENVNIFISQGPKAYTLALLSFYKEKHGTRCSKQSSLDAI